MVVITKITPIDSLAHGCGDLKNHHKALIVLYDQAIYNSNKPII